MPVPTYDDLLSPALQAVHALGGSCSIPEMSEHVARSLKLTDDEVNEIHRGNRTKLEYRLAWARTYLKNYGLLENSRRGVWSLTAKGRAVQSVDKDDVKRTVTEMFPRSGPNETDERLDQSDEDAIDPIGDEDWQEQLLAKLRSIPPDAFERLCQRILRESGFIQVEVVGRSGDGGIDGRGVVKVADLLSFHVHFQCKRYTGSVPAGDVRDFRGAMVGRADKGLIMTTGRFTRDATAEAQRDGAPPLDLVDGDALAEMLKRLGLGVKTELVESVTIDPTWFDNL